MGEDARRPAGLSRRQLLGRIGLAAAGALAALGVACGGAGGGTPRPAATAADGATPAGDASPAKPTTAPDAEPTKPPPSGAVQAANQAQPQAVKVLSVIAPAGADAFLEPNGVAIDADDNLYVANTAGKKVQKFSPDGKPAGAFAASGGDATPF